MSRSVFSLASEFPNDNPALHRGVMWVCEEVIGPPIPIRVPVEPEPFPEPEPITIIAPERRTIPRGEEETIPEEIVRTESGIIPIARSEEEDEEIVVEELEPLGESAVDEAAADDPYRQLCAVLAAVARAAGDAAVAEAVPALLLEHRVPALGEAARAALADAGLITNGALTDAFIATATAWCAVLRGTSDDLSACGGATLDEWAADLLARLLGSVDRAPAMRRDLRSRGVAAFGLLEAA
jgi:hypothetical protein